MYSQIEKLWVWIIPFFSLKFSLIASISALLYGAFLIWDVLKKPAGNEKMREISKAIQEGAAAYLKRQNKVVAMVGLVVFVILYFK